MQQNYLLTIRDLFSLNKGVQCGADAEVAILDDGVEVDRVVFSGKATHFQRCYKGKPGLSALIASGPGSIEMKPALLGLPADKVVGAYPV